MLLNKIINEDLEKIFKNKNIKWEKFKNKQVLVTGANGFIASNLINLFIFLNLKKKINVKIFITTRNKHKASKKYLTKENKKFIKIIKTDLQKKFNFSEKIDYLIHAASIATPKKYKIFPIDTLIPNVIGTFNLLSFAQKKNLKSFIFLSSGEIYGNSAAKKLSEETIYGFNTLSLRASYIESKKMGETLCYAYFKQKKIPIKIVRIFHTYGPLMQLDDGRVMMDFVKDAILNKNIHVKSDGTHKRSFCYISDLIQGILLVALNGKNGEAYNISNDKAESSIRQLAKLVGSLTNKKLIIKKRNLKKDNYQLSPFSTVRPSIEKIKKLGFKPSVSLKAGFRRTIESYFGDYTTSKINLK